MPLAARAGSYVPIDDRALVRRADAIAVVVVLSSHSIEADGMIVTDHLVSVEEWIKGESPAGNVAMIRETGGTVGQVSVVSSTAPRYRSGEKALVFLTRRSADLWSTFSGGLGKYRFAPELGSAVLVRDASDEEIVGSGSTPGAGSPRVRNAEAFLAFVRTAVAAGAEEPPPAAAADEGPLESHSAAIAGTAAGVWNGDPTSTISVAIGGTAASNSYGSSNGTNTINFNVPESFTYGGGTQPLAGGTVGEALLRASGTKHSSSLGESYYTSFECDVVVEGGFDTSVTTTIAAHEMGHCLGFRHSTEGVPSSNDALMYPSVSPSWSLKSWDRDAANQVYGNGTFGPTDSGNAFLMQFGFSPPGGARWQSGGFSMGVFVTAACTAPAITAHPQSVTIANGQSATLSVTATGATSYQWYRGSKGTTTNPIAGATGASYITPALTATEQFWVRATNSCGAADSNTATVTVSCPKPSISDQPDSQVITPGQSVVLSVTGSGADSLQWYRGTSPNTANPIAGATASSYQTGPLASTTSFWVRLTNACGSTDSATATVSVCTEPSIVTQPQDATVTTGDSATLTVVATGATSFQWYRGTKGSTVNPIPGATAAFYNTGPLAATSQYWVRVANACGSKDSNTVTVTVQSGCVPPAITAQPQSTSVASGQSATLTVSATGTAPQYQWYEGPSGDTGRPIAGATGPSYTTPPLTAVAQYWVSVANACGSRASEAATVTIGCPLAITNQPDDVTIAKGERATFSVEATGPEPLTYQWFVGASGDESHPIPGAKGSVLATGALVTTTKFWVNVSSPCGSVASVTATASVPGRRRLVVR